MRGRYFTCIHLTLLLGVSFTASCTAMPVARMPVGFPRLPAAASFGNVWVEVRMKNRTQVTMPLTYFLQVSTGVDAKNLIKRGQPYHLPGPDHSGGC